MFIHRNISIKLLMHLILKDQPCRHMASSGVRSQQKIKLSGVIYSYGSYRVDFMRKLKSVLYNT